MFAYQNRLAPSIFWLLKIYSLNIFTRRLVYSEWVIYKHVVSTQVSKCLKIHAFLGWKALKYGINK